MIVCTKGIVLHNIKYSESGIICKIFTEEHGLVSFIVNGVRSTKSKEKAGLYQPMQLVEIVYTYHENKSLLYIKECRAAEAFLQIPFKFERAGIGLFILEVLNKTIKEEREPYPEKFHMIWEALLFLDRAEKIYPSFHLAFMIKYITYMGYELDIDEDKKFFDLQSGHSTNEQPAHIFYITGEEKAVWYGLKNNPYSEEPSAMLNRERRMAILRHIEYFYQYHISNFTALNSPEVLSELYA